MPQATFIHHGGVIGYTPTSAVAAGDVVVQGDLIGVAKRAIPANTLGALAVEGVFDFNKVTGPDTAIAVGALVYWDDVNKQATAVAAGNKQIGKAVRAAADADAKVRVRMNQ